MILPKLTHLALGTQMLCDFTKINISVQLGGLLFRSSDPGLQWMGAWPEDMRRILTHYNFLWSITLQGFFVDLPEEERKECP